MKDIPMARLLLLLILVPIVIACRETPPPFEQAIEADEPTYYYRTDSESGQPTQEDQEMREAISAAMDLEDKDALFSDKPLHNRQCDMPSRGALKEGMETIKRTSPPRTPPDN